ncbi:MAG TPA: hypothetical protein VGB97_03170 [Candidatus Paceibacterota bacterium]|jgi:hypothetical protein
MPVLVQWFLSYILVSLAAHFYTRRIPNFQKQVLYIHVFVGVSVALLILVGARLEWSPTALSILTLSGVVGLAASLLGRLGVLYSFSCVLQEACLLLSGTFVATVIGLPLAAAATAAPYVFAHRTEGKEWYWKPIILLLWCFASIYLYIWLKQPLLNIALHILFGAVLIEKRLLYRLGES